MVAFALRDDGWYLRQEIIWSKSNPMPESVTDRCTKSHEHLFLLAKSSRYYFDQEAILEPVSDNTHARVSQDVLNQIGSERANAGQRRTQNMKAVTRQKMPGGWDTGDGHHGSFHRNGRSVPPKTSAAPRGVKNNPSFHAAMVLPTGPRFGGMRNRRSVWTVTTQPFKEAHFATFPPGLIEPAIKAGCPKGGAVLDPFGGAGTTALVADRLGRNAILIELKDDYIDLTRRRLRGSEDDFLAASMSVTVE